MKNTFLGIMRVYEKNHETWPIVWRDGIAASLKCYLGRGLSNGHHLTTSEQIFHTVQFAKNLHTTLYCKIMRINIRRFL